jgi:hypothetical protein
MTQAAPRKPAARPASRLPVSRPVLWTGIALGAFLAAEALLHRLVLPLGLPGFASAAITAVLIVALAVAAAELTRRHHRAAARHAIRHGKRGVAAAARHARRHGGTVRAWLVSRARSRWENREHRPLMFRGLRGDPEAPEPHEEGSAGTQGSGEAGGRTYSWGPADSPSGWPAHSPEVAHRWARRMSTGGGTPQVVTEYRPGGGPGRTIATYVNGKPAPDHAGTNGGTTSMTVSKITPDRRARRTAAQTGGSIPFQWGPVVAQAADFEPESDGHLLDWMAGQVTGMAAYAEALIEAYETGVNAVGIDPKGLAALHDVADAAAHAAETMAAAKAKFTEHYELPREFAANGGLMTHDGRWVTGEGA